MLEVRGAQVSPFSCGAADAPLTSPVSTRVEAIARAARGETCAARKQGASRPIQIEKHDVSHEEQR